MTTAQIEFERGKMLVDIYTNDLNNKWGDWGKHFLMAPIEEKYNIFERFGKLVEIDLKNAIKDELAFVKHTEALQLLKTLDFNKNGTGIKALKDTCNILNERIEERHKTLNKNSNFYQLIKKYLKAIATIENNKPADNVNPNP